MENINIFAFGSAIIIGCLVGLYFLGKYFQKKGIPSSGKIKVSGNDINDLVQKIQPTPAKNKVDFHVVDTYKYEDVVTWINETDLGDASESDDEYCCLLVRNPKVINDFNIDLSSLSNQQLDLVYGALIVKLKDNSIINQKWTIANQIDEDLVSIFGDNNSVVLK